MAAHGTGADIWRGLCALAIVVGIIAMCVSQDFGWLVLTGFGLIGLILAG